MKVLRSVLAIVLAGLFTVLALPPSALAANEFECNEKIVDFTNDRVLDIKKVQSSVDSVERFGADVYVRAYQNTPGGNTDVFWERGRDVCANWRSPNGTPKSNVIMVVFGLDRQSAIFYGGNFNSLAPSIDSIRADKMNASFRSGDFTGGVTRALESVAAGIDPNRPVSSSSTDYTALKWVGVALGIAVILALIVWGLVLNARRRARIRSERKLRAETQAAAKDARDHAANMMTSITEDDAIERDFLVACGNLPDEFVAPKRKKLDQLKTRVDELNQVFLDSNMDPSKDPDKGLSTEQYSKLHDTYSTVGRGLEDIQNQYLTLITELEEDKARLTTDARRSLLDAAEENLDSFKQLLSACKEIFEVSSYQGSLESLQESAELAKIHLDDGTAPYVSYKEVSTLARKVSSLLETSHELQSAQKKISDAQRLIDNQIEARKSVLGQLQYADGSAAVRELEQLSPDVAELIGSLASSRRHVEQIGMIDSFIQRVQQVGSDAVRKNLDTIEEKRRAAEEAARKKREKERQEREAREEREREERRRRSSSSDAFTGGIIGGSIGSSGGGSSGSGFGGSSGSWGGSDGGGSSGSW